MAKKTALDVIKEDRSRLVNLIVKNLEEKGEGWFKEWTSVATPHNGINGTTYRGGNRLKLGAVALENGFDDPRWATDRQIKENGWEIEKGAKFVICEHWKFTKTIEVFNEDTKETEKKEVKLNNPIVTWFKVYNFSQVKGAPEFKIPERIKDKEVEKVITILQKSSKCEINYYNQDRAFYDIRQDKIVMPNADLFINDKGHVSTLIHEMAHSTGHKTRLNRDIDMAFFGTPDYAREELRAEISSMFLQNDLRIATDERHFNNNNEYIKSWITILKNDPNEIYRASADAEKISDFLLKEYKEIEKAIEHEEVNIENKIEIIEPKLLKPNEIDQELAY